MSLRSPLFFSERSRTNPRRRQKGSQAHGSLSTKKKLFSIQHCCLNAKLIHRQSICTTSQFVYTNWKKNNIDQNCKTPSSGGNVKNGWWCFLSASSPNPCIPVLNRALNPGDHQVSLKWQIPTSSRFLQRYTLLSCSSFAIKLWEGRFQRSPRFERDPCGKRPVFLQKVRLQRKLGIPRLLPENVHFWWRERYISNNESRSSWWHSGGLATCLSLFHLRLCL